MRTYNTPATQSLCKALRDRTIAVSLQEHCLPLMKEIANGNEVQALVALSLARVLGSSAEDSNGIIEGGIILLQDEHFLLVLRTSLAGAVSESEFIEYPSSDRIFLNCSAKTASVQTFHRPMIQNIQEFNSNLRLEPIGQIDITPGDAVFISGSEYAVNVGAALNLANISLYDLRDATPLRWAFDKKRMMASFLSVGDRPLSALKTKIELLGWLGGATDSYQHYISMLESFITHHVHIIRWTAIQSVCAIDFDRGLIHLKNALHDEHPEIRRAAARAIQLEEGDF
jgi:hypothetical protein